MKPDIKVGISKAKTKVKVISLYVILFFLLAMVGSASVAVTLALIAILGYFLWKRGTDTKRLMTALAVSICALGFGRIVAANPAPKPSPSVPVASVTPSPTPSATPTPTPTPIPSPTHTPSPTPFPTATPTSTPSPKATDLSAYNQNAAALLQPVVQHYADKLAQGKQVLGTTQYHDANAGLAAMNDPNSAASRFSQFNQSYKSELGTDTSVTDTWKSALNIYPDTATPPQALEDWSYDMGYVASDLGAWVETAVSWQISSVPTSDLSKAEQKVRDDLAKANTDIAIIKAGH